MTDNITTYGGWIVALVVALFGAFAQFRKSNVDETAAVLSEWKKLIDAHQKQISGLVLEITDLRQRLVGAEKRITELESALRERDDLIAGLRRQMAASSQAVAIRLGPLVRDDSMDDEIGKLDRAGDNSTGGDG